MTDPQLTRPIEKPKRRRTLFQRIVNVFLYIGLIAFAAFLFLFGFSQTHIFKDWLRDFVVETANENLNGKLSIGRIEGTIFTSLILKNTVVTMGKDTLLNSGLIELRTSPLKIFLKKIYVRKAEIKDTQIRLIADSLGEFNITKLFPPSEEDEDTSKGSFPFRIEVADFKLTNVDFSFQNYNKVGSSDVYPSMNMDDFRVDDIFLSLKAFADIDHNFYETKIDYLSFNPNISSFNLKSFSGEFGIKPEEIIANNLDIKTANSEIQLMAKVNGLNIFDSTFTEKLNFAVVDLSLTSNKFNFDDLSAFVPPIDMLKGAVGVQFQASGNLKQMDVNKIILDYENTHIETRTIIKNIDNVDEMTIAADFKNSYINQSDINKLLPEFGIPTFEKLGVVKIDSLTFNGKPLNFASRMVLTTKEGSVSSNIKMNLEKPVTEYDITFGSKNFNLFPIANLSSNLNLRGSFSGRGFSPKEMNADIQLIADGSSVEGIKLDSASIIAKAEGGIIDYSFFTVSDKASAEIDGSLDFLNENLGYKADGKVSNLDIGKLMNDTTTATDLNFSFKTEGENFDIDKMNMFLTFDLAPSMINGIPIDSTKTITDIFTDNNDERVINFISDIADITLKGKFSLTDAIEVITNETSLLTNAFMKKIDEILPSQKKLENSEGQSIVQKKLLKKNPRTKEYTSIKYLVDLKDFALITPFLDEKRLEIDGDLSGDFVYNSDSVYLNMSSNLNYVKYWGKQDVFFISRLTLDGDVKNSFDAVSTEDVAINLSAAVRRVFAGADLNNMYLNFSLEENIAIIGLGSKIENYASADLHGIVDLQNPVVGIEFDTLDLDYNGFNINNKDKLILSFNQNRVDFKQFNLFHNKGEISANGFLSFNTDQNLKLKANNLSGRDLIRSFSTSDGLSLLDISLNLDAELTGDLASPILNVDLNGKDLTYKEKTFGDLVSVFRYSDKNFSSDIKFYDSFSGVPIPALKLNGNIPMNLSFTDSGKVIIDDEDIEINLTSNNLDLTPFGELIPGVSKFKGNLNCDVSVNGTVQEPYPDGFLKLDNSSFLLKYNNLEYNAGLKLSVTRDDFKLDSLLLENSPNTKNGGKITGSGTAELENFSMTSSQFDFNGSLKVLSDESKFVSPNLYGDLVISTDGNFELKIDKDGAKLTAPINVDVARLTYTQTQGGYTSGSENFIYKFIEDTVTKNSKIIDFEELINLSKLNEAEKIQQVSKPSKFDYRIDVKVEDEAVLTYVLSREFNQNLVAVLSGNFNYESIAGKPVAQGELKLLEGSTLEFIKTLTAEGIIRFESELSNPYLDITATYKNFYYPQEGSSTNNSADQSGSDEVEVAVKMRIKGSLRELDKNLAKQSEKLTVYYGAKNIEDNIPDPTKDASDAVMFMLLDKFNDNVTQQERNMVSTYAASFAGSLVGGFLNRQFGEYVKSLDIRQSGSDTKFILAGRAGKFRYTIGGSTAVFQDLGLANVKIEYPITRSFFMRLERKEALSETKYINEMINELGLKYRFEF